MPNVSRMVKNYESMLKSRGGTLVQPRPDNLGKDTLHDSLQPGPKTEKAPTPEPKVLTSVGKVQSTGTGPVEQGAQRIDEPVLGPDHDRIRTIRRQMQLPLSAPITGLEVIDLGNSVLTAVGRLGQDPITAPLMGLFAQQAQNLMSMATEFMVLDAEEMTGGAVDMKRSALCRRLEGTLAVLDPSLLPEVAGTVDVLKMRASALASIYLDLHLANLPIHRQ